MTLPENFPKSRKEQESTQVNNIWFFVIIWFTFWLEHQVGKFQVKKEIQAWIFRRAEKFRAQTGTFLTGKWKMRWKMFINLRIWVERCFRRFCDVMKVESESEVWVASSTHVTHCLYSKLHAFNATRIFGCSMNDNVLIQYLLWIMKVIWASGNLVALLGFVARLSIWNRDEIVNGNKESQRKLIQYSLLMLCCALFCSAVSFGRFPDN